MRKWLFYCCLNCHRHKNSECVDLKLINYFRQKKTFILNYFFSEVEQSLAGLISDRATDEVLEALTRYKRGMGIPDSPNIAHNDAPDIVRSRSSHVSAVDKIYIQLYPTKFYNVHEIGFSR